MNQIDDLGSLQRTYSGLLDDVMIRFSRDYASDAFFNKMIVKNLLFGGGIYLNDGYLVNHVTARKNLYLEDGLLRQMINTGFIRILTRASDRESLYRMPSSMAQSGSSSFSQLINSVEWDDFAPLFRKVSASVFHNGNARPWPAFDMSHGFTKLMARSLDAPPHEIGITAWTEDELRNLKKAFFASDPKAGNSRHKLQEAAENFVKDRGSRADYYEAMRQIMDIGNQAYHYNFGLTLTDEDDFGVVVDTTFGHAFDELLQTREIEQGELDDFPLIQLPDNLPFDDGATFLPFLDPAHSVGGAKLHYMNTMRDLLDAQGVAVSDKKKNLTEATNHYLEVVKYLFERKYGKLSAELAFEQTFAMARGTLGSPRSDSDVTVATAAANGGLALNLQNQAMNQSRQLLMEKFKLRDVSDTFRRDPAKEITVGEIRPQIASLAFNPDEAKKFVFDLPRFN